MGRIHMGAFKQGTVARALGSGTACMLRQGSVAYPQSGGDYWLTMCAGGAGLVAWLV